MSSAHYYLSPMAAERNCNGVKFVRTTFLLSTLVALILQASIFTLSTEGIFSDDNELPISTISYWNYPSHNKTTLNILNEEQQSSNFIIKERYQNPTILRDGCAATVLLVDPDIKDDVQWALESVAANIHPIEKICFLLQTSICNVQAMNTTNPTDDEKYDIKVRHVMRNAKPKFRSMIERGNVRMTILDYTKYRLRSCHNFYNPSFLFENYEYWGSNEFDESDSDLIMMMQGDAVLCHDLHIDKWKDVAWVGAPWAAAKGNMPWKYCTSMPKQWKKFHEATGYSKDLPPFPSEDKICSDTRYGPQGNGGLGLRSRKWLRKAIQYCPTSRFEVSGLSASVFNATVCKATEIHAEDMYFVTILRGLGAPLPGNYEAALFALETRSPSQIAGQYKLNQTFIEEMVSKRWYSVDDPSGMKRYNMMVEGGKNLSNNRDSIIPIGLHKPWNQALVKRINEPYLNGYCPYMMKMVQHSKYGKDYIGKT